MTYLNWFYDHWAFSFIAIWVLGDVIAKIVRAFRMDPEDFW